MATRLELASRYGLAVFKLCWCDPPRFVKLPFMVRSRNQLTFDGEGWAMARIGKQEHPRILQMVDTEHRKVAEVAAEYGCTPANIYVLLGKLRREASRSVETAGAIQNAAEKASSLNVEEQLLPDSAAPAAIADAQDLFASRSGSGESPALEPKGSRLQTPSTADAASSKVIEVSQKRPTSSLAAVPRQELPAGAPSTPRAVVERLPAPGTIRKATGVGAALSKPGMALVMRTADGEENMTPFRSLDDLLSAVKPILRAAVRSPDAVWFCIQPVDLASLDSDEV